MKIRIVTEYSNVTPEWYEWWLTRFESMPEYVGLEFSLNKYGTFTHKNEYKDELGHILGETIYQVTP